MYESIAESLHMSLPFTVHPDIIDVLIQSDLNEFKIPKIRDRLLATTMKNKSKDTVRLFVSRHLNAMVEHGLLVSTGTHRKKVFSKTKSFEQINTIIDGDLTNKIEVEFNTKATSEQKPYIAELGKIRSRLNAELAILIAEMDEYRSIMAQFPQTQEKVRKLHETSTQQSATLTGQITAITKTIELLQVEAE
jgi:RecJ-like exonuclease